MNLKQIKLSLAVVINLLTAIVFGYYCFLGENFHTLGDKGKSITLAVIITLLLIVTSLGAKMMKQTKRNCKICFIWEKILLVLFTILIVYFTYSPFSHYFGVLEKEDTIKQKLNDNISQAVTMYTEYETYFNNRDSSYKKNLNNAVKRFNKGQGRKEIDSFGLSDTNGITFDEQIKSKLGIHKDLLLPGNLPIIKTNATASLSIARISVNNFEPIRLLDVIKNLDNNTAKSLKDFVKFSKKKVQGLESYPPFTPSKLTPNNVKNYFTTIGTPSLLSIVLAIIGYLLMLLSWFITKRDTRCIGALTTAEYEVVL
jgi:hypothetical protein